MPQGKTRDALSTRRFLSVSDVLALHDPSWLADFVLPERSLGMLWGPPKIGKSFITLDLACSLVTGNSWLGRDVPKARPVLYVAGEGAHSFKRRTQAWLRYNSLAPEDLDGLTFVPWPIQLHEGVDTFLKLAQPYEPALVIIDTLAASTLGVAEDTTEGIGPVMKSLLKLRKELEAAIFVAHHTGWSVEHERGSSAMRGAMDVSIELRGEKGWKDEVDPNKDRRLICWKQRDAEEFKSIRFRMKEVRWPGQYGILKSLIPVLR